MKWESKYVWNHDSTGEILFIGKQNNVWNHGNEIEILFDGNQRNGSMNLKVGIEMMTWKTIALSYFEKVKHGCKNDEKRSECSIN